MPAKGEFKSSTNKNSKRQRAYLRKTVKNRVARNKARRAAIKDGRVSVGDSKAVNHIKPIIKGGSRDGATNIQSSKASLSQGGRLRRRRRK